jgi:DHA1 family bicyclomycin/chloramphenicol resistance-like MFS transporter
VDLALFVIPVSCEAIPSCTLEEVPSCVAALMGERPTEVRAAPPAARPGSPPVVGARVPTLLGGITMLGPLAVDLYLPSLPALERSFDAGASAAQLTLTSFFVGMALGTVAVGPLSDRFGRRTPMRMGLVAFVVATAACAVAPSLSALVVFRLLQGAAVSSGVVIANATIRDISAGAVAARLYSFVFAVLMIGPVVAPLIGAELLTLGSWRYVFFALALYAVCITVLALRSFPETLDADSRRSGTLAEEFALFGGMLRDRRLLAVVVGQSLSLGAFNAYLGGSSLVLQHVYRLSPREYGVVFALNSVGILAATVLNRRMLVRRTRDQLFQRGLATAAAAAGALLAVAIIGDLGLFGFLVPLFVFVASIAFIMPNATALALDRYAVAAGAAAAMLSVTQLTVGAVASPLAGVAGSGTAVPLACVMAFTTLAGWVGYRRLSVPKGRS